MQTLIDFMTNIFMNERYSIAQLNFIVLPIFIESPGETIAVGIDILVGWIIARIIPDEKISMFSDRIVPRQPELIISLVEFGLQRPFKVELKMIIFLKRRSISNQSTQSSCPMSVDVLLNTSEQRSFLFGMDVDARHIVGTLYFLHSLLYDKLILLMR